MLLPTEMSTCLLLTDIFLWKPYKSKYKSNWTRIYGDGEEENNDNDNKTTITLTTMTTTTTKLVYWYICQQIFVKTLFIQKIYCDFLGFLRYWWYYLHTLRCYCGLLYSGGPTPGSEIKHNSWVTGLVAKEVFLCCSIIGGSCQKIVHSPCVSIMPNMIMASLVQCSPVKYSVEGFSAVEFRVV